uniref:Uncharacterized protein n=1 Tax=Cucumis melo TaxID=3656 RepID=A0A9I9E5F3_CUCME
MFHALMSNQFIETRTHTKTRLEINSRLKGTTTTTLQHPKFRSLSSSPSEPLSLVGSHTHDIDEKLLGFANFFSAYRWIKKIWVSMSFVAWTNNAKAMAVTRKDGMLMEFIECTSNVKDVVRYLFKEVDFRIENCGLQSRIMLIYKVGVSFKYLFKGECSAPMYNNINKVDYEREIRFISPFNLGWNYYLVLALQMVLQESIGAVKPY